MRECIYCGRQLEKGEQCDCAVSVAKRRAKTENEQKGNGDAAEKNRRKEEKLNEKKRQKERKENEKNARREQARAWKETRRNNGSDAKLVFSEFWRLLVKFVKSPVETIMNPGEMSKSLMLLFVLAEGIAGGLSVYSVLTGAVRGAFGFLGNIIGLNGIGGYDMIKGGIMAALSGAVAGVLIFFAYSGVFYVVNRWLFKQFTPYWEFVKRFVFAALPMSILGVAGVVLGVFSQTTFTALLLCGVVGSLLITYEILRSVWYSKSTTVTIYTMMVCIFVFIALVTDFIRIAG